MQEEKGCVYILTNPAFKDNWVKIGMTSGEPNVRASELDNTAVPLPFEVYAVLKTSKYVKAEKFIHWMIDRLTDLRVRPNREFFEITPEEAFGIFTDISELFDDSELIRYSPLTEESNDDQDISNHYRRANTEFNKVGVKPGDTLYIKEFPTVECKVIDECNKIEYEGQIYALSTWVVEIFKLNGKNRSASNGFSHTCKKGEVLTLFEKRLELEKLGQYK